MIAERRSARGVSAALAILLGVLVASALYPSSGDGSSAKRADVTVTVNFFPGNTGTGTVTGTGINCPGDCTETYPQGTGVSLYANPDPGSTFTGWANACEGSPSPCNLNGSDDATVTARFASTGPPPDKTAPETTITKAPDEKVKTKKKKAKVRFEFGSSEDDSTFECRLDELPFESCTSPTQLKAKRGKHTFEARATDAAGNAEATAASVDFKVVKKKKKN